MSLELIRDYFGGLAESWDENLSADPEKIDRILDVCKVCPGHRVVDIACGTGVLFGHILERQPSYLAGVDLCEAMINKARSKHNDERLNVAAKDFLSFDEYGFDRALLYNAYPHFFDKAALARKIHSVLNFGGRFIIAHGQGRHGVNGVHKSKRAKSVSVALKEAAKEKEWFEPLFDIDVVIDKQEIYMISGTKK